MLDEELFFCLLEPPPVSVDSSSLSSSVLVEVVEVSVRVSVECGLAADIESYDEYVVDDDEDDVDVDDVEVDVVLCRDQDAMVRRAEQRGGSERRGGEMRHKHATAREREEGGGT